MISRVYIKNWKSHGNTEIVFTEGTNVIIGKNGAGKSSVLDAIYFALYGVLPAREYGAVLRHGASEGKVKVEIELNGERIEVTREFNKNGTTNAEVRVNGALKTKGTKAVNAFVFEKTGIDAKGFQEIVYARQNSIDEILLLRPGERKERFDRLFRLDEFESARKTVSSLKKRLEAFVKSVDVGELKQELSKCRGEIEEAKKELEEVEKELSRCKEEFEAITNEFESVEKDLGILEKELEEARRKKEEYVHLKAQIAELEKRIDELKEYRRENAEGELEKVKLKIESIKQALSRAKQMDMEISGIKKLLEEKKREMASIIADEHAAEKLEEVEQELHDLERKAEELENMKEIIEKEYFEIEAELKHLEEALGNYLERKKVFEEKETLQPELLEEKERISGEIKEIEQKILELSSLKSLVEAKGLERCPVCGLPVNPERKEAIMNEISECDQKVDQLRKDIDALKKKLEEVEKSLLEIDMLEEELKSFESEGLEEKIRVKKTLKETLEKRLEEAHSKLKALRESIEKKREEKERLKKEVELLERKRDLEQSIKDLEQKLSALLEEKAQLPAVDESALERAREEYEELVKAVELEKSEREAEEKKKKMQELEGYVQKALTLEDKYLSLREKFSALLERKKSLLEKKEALERSIDERKKMLSLLEEKEKNLEREIEEVEIYSRKASEMEKLERIVKTVQEIVREKRTAAVNRVLNIMWGALYPYGDIESVAIQPTTDDYAVKVKKKDGRSVPISMLSGGERALVAISLRVAMSSLLGRSFGVIFLDEPTHNLDKNATETLAELLKNLPEEGLFRQIILITHNDELQKAATKKVYVLDRDKEEGGVTKVEALSV